MNKRNITVSIMPTYSCRKSCPYCYLSDTARSHGTYLSEESFVKKLFRRFKELYTSGYNVTAVEMYGGDVSLLSDEFIKAITEVYRCYCKNDFVTWDNVERAEKAGFPINRINVSLNEERGDFTHNYVLTRAYPDVNVLTVVTKSVLQTPINDLFKRYEHLRGNLTFIPQSNTNAYPVPYMSNYSYCLFMIKMFDYYLKNKSQYSFTITNALLLDDCINGLYSPAMRNNIFITPKCKFACVEFDSNGQEYFREYSSLGEWEARCKLEDTQRLERCGTCDYFDTCMAEHFRTVKQEGSYSKEISDICNGYKPLVDWYKEHKDGFSN